MDLKLKILILLLLPLSGIAQTTWVVNYLESSRFTIELPDGATVSASKGALHFDTPQLRLSVPQPFVRGHFRASEAYLADSLPAHTPYLRCDGTRLEFCDPCRTQYAHLLRPDNTLLQAYPPSGEPTTLSLLDLPPTPTILHFGPAIKISPKSKK